MISGSRSFGIVSAIEKMTETKESRNRVIEGEGYWVEVANIALRRLAGIRKAEGYLSSAVLTKEDPSIFLGLNARYWTTRRGTRGTPGYGDTVIPAFIAFLKNADEALVLGVLEMLDNPPIQYRYAVSDLLVKLKPHDQELLRVLSTRHFFHAEKADKRIKSIMRRLYRSTDPRYASKKLSYVYGDDITRETLPARKWRNAPRETGWPVITIEPEGDVFLNGKWVLKYYLSETLRNHEKDSGELRVILIVRPSTSYGTARNVFRVCADAGAIILAEGSIENDNPMPAEELRKARETGWEEMNAWEQSHADTRKLKNLDGELERIQREYRALKKARQTRASTESESLDAKK